MDNVIFLSGRRNGKTTIAKKLNEARTTMSKQKQEQKVYIGGDAESSALTDRPVEDQIKYGLDPEKYKDHM